VVERPASGTLATSANQFPEARTEDVRYCLAIGPNRADDFVKPGASRSRSNDWLAGTYVAPGEAHATSKTTINQTNLMILFANLERAKGIEPSTLSLGS
jgi:hypothetical protein